MSWGVSDLFLSSTSDVMKSYPSIPGGIRRGVPLYVFDKLDGSNVRVEWTRKRGMAKFGRRNGLLDDSTPFLNEAEALMLEYEDALSRICRKQRWDKVTAFFEFHGENSFAGNHVDEPHRVTLIDVAVDRKGFVEPGEFIKLFADDIEIPNLLHHGNWTDEIKEAVTHGTLDGMTFEGIVAKGPWDRKLGKPYMGKWKHLGWFEKLQEFRSVEPDDAEMLADIQEGVVVKPC